MDRYIDLYRRRIEKIEGWTNNAPDPERQHRCLILLREYNFKKLLDRQIRIFNDD